jgi:hypothetical protein
VARPRASMPLRDATTIFDQMPDTAPRNQCLQTGEAVLAPSWREASAARHSLYDRGASV